MKVRLGVISLLLFGLLVAGCARTVTQYVDYGRQMVVEVDLRGTAEVTSHRYFLVLSSTPDFKIPLPPPAEKLDAPEFIEPGMTPVLGSAEAYFSNFFSTWSGYVVIDFGGSFTVKGPFAIGSSVTREVFSGPEDLSSKIKFIFDLSRIFDTSIPDNIYFDFVAVNWPEGQPKIPQDHLESTNALISKILGSIKEISDEENPDLDPSVDILKCTVTIQ